MTRTSMLATAAVAATALGLCGWAVAEVLRPVAHEVAADGRRLELRYEIRREAPYAPPPPTEATLLQVLTPQAPTRVEDEVLSAQAGDALRSLQAEDAARNAAALASIRAEDARIDRETASQLAETRATDAALQPPASTPMETAIPS